MFVKVALHFFYSSTFHKSFVVFLKDLFLFSLYAIFKVQWVTFVENVTCFPIGKRGTYQGFTKVAPFASLERFFESFYWCLQSKASLEL